MPILQPAVLKQFLSDYLAQLDSKGSTVWGALSTLSSQVLGKVTGGDTRRICNHFIERFDSTQTAEDWIAIILDLGKEAANIQANTVLNYSTCCAKLHAVRAYMLRKILASANNTGNSDEEKTDSLTEDEKLFSQLQDKINAIKAILKETQENNRRLINDSVNFLVIEQNQQKIDALQRDLAYLGSKDHLDSLPVIKGLFPEKLYQYPTQSEVEIYSFVAHHPLILQKNYDIFSLRQPHYKKGEEIIRAFEIAATANHDAKQVPLPVNPAKLTLSANRSEEKNNTDVDDSKTGSSPASSPTLDALLDENVAANSTGGIMQALPPITPTSDPEVAPAASPPVLASPPVNLSKNKLKRLKQQAALENRNTPVGP